MEYNFAGANHYKTIHTFLDSRKDFIVLGLCGKTGSGCSTAADILQMTFEQMNLPKPGDNCKDGIEAHEYRVLHTYANVHWKPFYRIKTSALITAHILEKSEEEFISFLGDYFKNGEHDAKEMKEIVEDFFQEEMGLCLAEYRDGFLPDKRPVPNFQRVLQKTPGEKQLSESAPDPSSPRVYLRFSPQAVQHAVG